ncbi:toxin-antitoxin system YwqK family antitoxin [Streptomyces sp. NPDC058157]|uniref:toxin-antitoxin system YwqK family antitoxin n=1 Tax=Streptomyces sp. NPDC058157 TaxID=3346360 RepID=UPI0036EDE922
MAPEEPTPTTAPVRRVDADDPDVDLDMGHRLLYRDGLFTGEVAEYQDGRIVALDVYRDGILNGPSRMWFPDGTAKLRGTVVNGSASGEFLEWHPNGVLKSRKFFDDDIYSLKEESVWDEHGCLVRAWHRASDDRNDRNESDDRDDRDDR